MMKGADTPTHAISTLHDRRPCAPTLVYIFIGHGRQRRYVPRRARVRAVHEGDDARSHWQGSSAADRPRV